MGRSLATLVVTAALFAACSDDAAGTDAGGGADAAKPIAPMDASTAGAEALTFDEKAAKALNAEFPPADPKTVCGADDRRFLAELLAAGSNPLSFMIPKRLADVKESPSEVAVSGSVVESSLGTGDFPFDHTMGSDFNADVRLDAPYRGAGQEKAVTIDTLHIELAAGQLPHLAAAAGPAEQAWEAMTARAREKIQDGFVPEAGDRVLVMGHWIVDCGHVNFQTEIHPITFMAVARTEGDATIVHAFYNPYRETQLYHPDPDKALAFDEAGRLTLPDTKPFPSALVSALLRIQDAAPKPYPSADRLESWALLEPNTTSPVAFRVCAPGKPGKAQVGARFVTRKDVSIDVTPDGATGCADVSIDVGGAKPGIPEQHRCTTPWDFLSEVASAEASGQERAPDAGMIDLKMQIGGFVSAQYRDRLDLDPVMNCYDPLAGPDLGDARPSDIDVTSDADALLPLYGTIVVRVPE